MPNTTQEKVISKISDTPLQEQERQVLYELLTELFLDADKDSTVPDLADLFALIVFTDTGDVDGALLERSRISDCLPEEALDMVNNLPTPHPESFLLVIGHPKGTGVFNASMSDIRAALAKKPVAEKSPLDSLQAELGAHNTVSRKQCAMILQAVNGLCTKLSELPNAPACHEVVSIIDLDADGVVHGRLVEYNKLLKVTSPEVMKAVMGHPNRVPGRMLVVLSLGNGAGGVFSVTVGELPNTASRASTGRLLH